MKKKELVTGMVTVNRRGSVSRVMLDTVYGSLLVQSNNLQMAPFENYDEELNYYAYKERFEDCDIMEVHDVPLVYKGTLEEQLTEETRLYKRGTKPTGIAKPLTSPLHGRNNPREAGGVNPMYETALRECEMLTEKRNHVGLTEDEYEWLIACENYLNHHM